MTLSEWVDALELPSETRVDKPIPRKLFLEQGAPTPSDKRLIQDGLESAVWWAALKPESTAIPAYRDPDRDYAEIAVLTVVLRNDAKVSRLTELIHRAVPYPLVLLVDTGSSTGLSLSHKRNSQGQAGKVVLDGSIVSATLSSPPAAIEITFLGSLCLADQPSQDLRSAFQGWVERLEALAAGRITGRFHLMPDSERVMARHKALEEYGRVQGEIAGLKGQAEKKSQMIRLVDLNLRISRLRGDLTGLSSSL